MRVLSWNIRGNTSIRPERVDRIAAAIAGLKPDVVALQEVFGGEVTGRLRDRLREHGLSEFYTTASAENAKPYGNVIASRWKLEASSSGPNAFPFPELLATSTVTTPSGRLKVHCVHVPTLTHGWKKIETMEQLFDIVRSDAKAGPTVLLGDFNEPQRWEPGKPIVTFGQRKLSKDWSSEGMKKMKDRTHPWKRWDDAARRLLEGDEHGLRHAYWTSGEQTETPTTWHGPKLPYFLDHIFVSEHLEVSRVGFEHKWREDKISDHSGIWADLEFR